jgi:hypothetical protein
VLLVVTYSQNARQTLRNICQSHDDVVVQRFGRAVLLDATELGAFLALRLRERHGSAVQIERTHPFNEFEAVPKAIRAAARDYESKATKHTPYATFASGSEHPSPEEMAGRSL